jgi:hypothetical protein
MTGGGQEKYEQVLAVSLAFGRDRALFRHMRMEPRPRGAQCALGITEPLKGLGPSGDDR